MSDGKLMLTILHKTIETAGFATQPQRAVCTFVHAIDGRGEGGGRWVQSSVAAKVAKQMVVMLGKGTHETILFCTYPIAVMTIHKETFHFR